MEDRIKLITSQLGQERVKQKVNIGEFLKSNQQVQTDAFYIATTTRELIKAVDLCKELELDFIIIGSGSKVVFPRSEFKGMVIKNRVDGIRIFGIKGKVSSKGLGIQEALLEADSGSTLKKVAEYGDFQGLAGLENLYNYEGTVGGSLLDNQTLKGLVYQVKTYSEKGSFSNWEDEIETKTVFDVGEGDIILSVVFKLKSKKNPND